MATDGSDRLVQAPGRLRQARQSPLRVLLRHGWLLVLMLVMGLLAEVAAQPLSNGDTWFHLRLGHEFWGGWSLAHPRALTTFATSPWVPTQWSTEMVMAKAEDWLGLPGVAWMYGALYLIFLATVYLTSRLRGGGWSATLGTVLVTFAAASTLSARPQVISLILLSVTMAAWLRTERDLRLRWWLVPMTWAWATAHGMWSQGVLLSGVFWLGLVLDGKARGRDAVRLLSVPVLSFVAALLTPVGPGLVLSQFAVSTRSSMIAEWGPTSFRTVPAIAAAVLVALLVVLWARRGSASWTAVLLALLACGWILYVSRLVPLGAIVLAPLVAEALHRERHPCESPQRVGALERGVVWGAVAACLVGLAVAVPHTSTEAAGVPTRFQSRLAVLPKGTPVLVEDGTGAWIEWRFPTLNPVIDGMLDAYPVHYIKRFMHFRAVKPGWRSFVRDSDAHVAVLTKGSALSAGMQDQLHWRPVQREGEWVYLEAPSRR